MQFNPDETFWDDLLTYVDSGCVIPVLGQGAITYGDSDQPFYPWLARRLAEKLKVSVPEDAPAPSLNDIVCRHLLAGGGSNPVYLRLSQILVAECPEPGPTLRAFAVMEPFRLFLTTTFDPLLVRALNAARFGGQPRTTVGAIAPSADDRVADLPARLKDLQMCDWNAALPAWAGKSMLFFGIAERCNAAMQAALVALNLVCAVKRARNSSGRRITHPATVAPAGSNRSVRSGQLLRAKPFGAKGR